MQHQPNFRREAPSHPREISSVHLAHEIYQALGEEALLKFVSNAVVGLERPIKNNVTTVYNFEDSKLVHTENSYIFEYSAKDQDGAPVVVRAEEPAEFPPNRGHQAFYSATTLQPLIDNCTGWETLMEIMLDIETMAYQDRPEYASRCRAISLHCPLPGIELIREENYAELSAMHHQINEAIREFLPEEIFDLTRNHFAYFILNTLQDFDEIQYKNLRAVMLQALTDNPDIESCMSCVDPQQQDPEAESPPPKPWLYPIAQKVINWKESNPDWDRDLPLQGF